MSKTIKIDQTELFDEENSRIITVKETELVLEHSLLSVSKWEAIWKKPFLVDGALDTNEKVISYIKCMTITPQKPDPNVYLCLKEKDVKEIVDYINDPMTATWFKEEKKKKQINKEILTSEVIYWQMIALQIPIEFQKWHLNRLTTLIRVCNAKNNPEKMSKKDIAAENAAINKQRLAKMRANRVKK
jgi:hypothetical protein